MSIEQRLAKLEQQNRRQRIGLMLLAGALCAVFVMGAGGQDGKFEKVVAKSIFVTNDADQPVISMLPTNAGHGALLIGSAQGETLVGMRGTDEGYGTLSTFSPLGNMSVELTSNADGHGMVRTFSRKGKLLVGVGAVKRGGAFEIFNTKGESVVQLLVNKQFHGSVGAFNRKGRGRTLTPGP